MERSDLIKHSFTLSMLLVRKWEKLYNRLTDDSLTLKQLMLLIVIGHALDQPTIKEVSTIMSMSHQNVKALALQLEKKGFIELYKDSHDKRVTRLRVIEGKEAYWAERDEKDRQILNDMFMTIDDKALQEYVKTLQKLDLLSDEMMK